MRRALLLIAIVAASAVLAALAISRGALGVRENSGEISPHRRSDAELATARCRQREAADTQRISLVTCEQHRESSDDRGPQCQA